MKRIRKERKLKEVTYRQIWSELNEITLEDSNADRDNGIVCLVYGAVFCFHCYFVL